MRALSKYTLRDLETLLADLREVATAPQEQRIDSLLKTIRAVKAPKRGVSHRHQVAKEKVASKREQTARIREAVFARAEGRCEARGSVWCTEGATELDHFWSRRHGQAISSCWALCRNCHRAKTDGDPSAAHWLEAFKRHALKHGYINEEARANNRLAFVTTRSALGGGG